MTTVRLAILAASIFVVGCSTDREGGDGGDQNDPTEEKTILVETKLGVQVARGRRGETDRLVLRNQIADKEVLATLNVEDSWLEIVNLDAGVIDDELAKTFALLPNLVHLRLRHSPVGDRTLRALSGSASLQILNLPQCEATADGIAALAKLTSLRSIRIGGVNLTADAASAVASLSQLRSVHLIGVPVDDEGLREIADMPELNSLFIDDSEVTEEGWDWLFDHHANLHVHVNQRHQDRLPKQESGEAATRFSKDHAAGEHSP